MYLVFFLFFVLSFERLHNIPHVLSVVLIKLYEAIFTLVFSKKHIFMVIRVIVLNWLWLGFKSYVKTEFLDCLYSKLSENKALNSLYYIE